MTAERAIVVAVEDAATAGVVGAAAAHVAMEENATAIVVVHVVETHIVAQGLMTVALPEPMKETQDEAESVLAEAAAACCAEYVGLEQPVPSITKRWIGGIAAGTAIAEVADEVHAVKIVVGGRRPHAFGRFAHADVRSALSHHTRVPIHVAPLQAEEKHVTAPDAR